LRSKRARPRPRLIAYDKFNLASAARKGITRTSHNNVCFAARITRNLNVRRLREFNTGPALHDIST
jgi:hypothetical protein